MIDWLHIIIVPATHYLRQYFLEASVLPQADFAVYNDYDDDDDDDDDAVVVHLASRFLASVSFNSSDSSSCRKSFSCSRNAKIASLNCTLFANDNQIFFHRNICKKQVAH